MKRSYIAYIVVALLMQAGFIHAQIINTVAGTHLPGNSGNNVVATSAALNNPYGVCFSTTTDIYFIADYSNNYVKRVTDGFLDKYAGTGTAGYSGDSAQSSALKLNHPSGVVVDRAGRLFIADPDNNRIRMVYHGPGLDIMVTYAGTGVAGNTGDGGQATSATFSRPVAITVDSAGNLYVADQNNNRIRKIDTFGIITAFAGTGTAGYSGDGAQATLAKISRPLSVAADISGNIFIADNGNNVVRKVNALGIISTFAGTGTAGFNGDSILAATAMLDSPISVAADKVGDVFVSDTKNIRIRKINSAGLITTAAGTGVTGYFGNGYPATVATFTNLAGIATDSVGSLLIADQGNYVIRYVGTSAIRIAGPANGFVCPGASTDFHATALNTNLNYPTLFRWKKNGITVSTNVPDYTDNSLAAGDVITCELSYTDSSMMATSNAINITLGTLVTPSVTTTLFPHDTVCDGTTIVVTAAVSNGGALPDFEWIENGIATAFNNSPSYTASPGFPGGTIKCIVSSNAPCPDPVNASDTVSVIVTPNVMPAISISAFPGTDITQGQTVTFTADVINQGSIPVYQWYINGSPVAGATSDLFVSNTLTDNDMVTCMLNNQSICTQATDTSTPLTIHISAGVSAIANGSNTLSLAPNPNSGSFILRGTAAGSKTAHIDVMNITGQLVYASEARISDNKIEQGITLSGLPGGVYILSLKTSAGVQNIRFMINR